MKDATWLARRRGFFFDANRGEGADIFARAEDRRGFLEVFCAADHGTVTGLRERPDGRIEAEVDPGWAGPVAAWGLPTVRAAVEAFAEALAPAPVSAAEIGALRPVIGALLRDFWLDPSPDEARAWGAFPFNLGEGHGSFVAALAEPYGLARPAPGARRRQGAEEARAFLGRGGARRLACGAAPAARHRAAPAPPARARAGGAGRRLRLHYDKRTLGQACGPARGTPPAAAGQSRSISMPLTLAFSTTLTNSRSSLPSVTATWKVSSTAMFLPPASRKMS